MMLGLRSMRRYDARPKLLFTRKPLFQRVKAWANAALGVVLLVLIVIAVASPKKALPTATPEIEAAYQRGYAQAMAEPRRINPIDWTCAKEK